MLQDIDTRNIIVNQLLSPEKDEKGHVKCSKCRARQGIQNKYLDQVRVFCRLLHFAASYMYQVCLPVSPE